MGKHETHLWDNPQLPFIFKKMHLGAHHPYSGANWHENIEIIYVIEGAGTIWNNGEHSTVAQDDFVLLNSDCLHDFSSITNFYYYYLIIDNSFCYNNGFNVSNFLFQAFPFQNAELKTLFQKLIYEYESKNDTPFQTLTIRAIVLSILAIICQNHTFPLDEEQNSRSIGIIRKAIGYIKNNCQNSSLSLDHVATAIGYNKFHFAHTFKKITGFSCVHYINLIRCEMAKKLLREDKLEIKEIVHICGFNSQSYFTKTFHDYCGVSPSKYRQLKQKKSTEANS